MLSGANSHHRSAYALNCVPGHRCWSHWARSSFLQQFFYRWSPRSASAGTAVQALLSRLPEFGSAYALPVEASLLLAQSSDPQAPLLLLRRLRSRDAARMRLPWASAKVCFRATALHECQCLLAVIACRSRSPHAFRLFGAQDSIEVLE